MSAALEQGETRTARERASILARRATIVNRARRLLRGSGLVSSRQEHENADSPVWSPMPTHERTFGMSAGDEKSGDATHESYLAVLLISLIFLLLVVPAIEQSSFAAGLFRVGITAVLISAAVATRRRKILLVVGLLFAGVAAPLSWMTMFFEQPALFLFSSVLEGAFFVVMAILILITAIQRHMATVHSIFGAISAYLLLGLAWAVV